LLIWRVASRYKSRLIPFFYAQVCCFSHIMYWRYRHVVFFVFYPALSYSLIIISASFLHPFEYYILILFFFPICLVHHDVTFFIFLPAFFTSHSLSFFSLCFPFILFLFFVFCFLLFHLLLLYFYAFPSCFPLFLALLMIHNLLFPLPSFISSF